MLTIQGTLLIQSPGHTRTVLRGCGHTPSIRPCGEEDVEAKIRLPWTLQNSCGESNVGYYEGMIGIAKFSQRNYLKSCITETFEFYYPATYRNFQLLFILTLLVSVYYPAICINYQMLFIMKLLMLFIIIWIIIIWDIINHRFNMSMITSQMIRPIITFWQYYRIPWV